MKKELKIILGIILLIGLVGLAFSIEYLVKNFSTVDHSSYSNLDKVNMTIKNGTLSKNGVTLVVSDKNELPYLISDEYIIQKKFFNTWKALKTIDNEFECGLANMKTTPELKIDWSKKYGELTKGTYRIGRYTYDSKLGTVYIYSEFNIE